MVVGWLAVVKSKSGIAGLQKTGYHKNTKEVCSLATAVDQRMIHRGVVLMSNRRNLDRALEVVRSNRFNISGLSRRSGVKYGTLQRIRDGQTKNPHQRVIDAILSADGEPQVPSDVLAFFDEVERRGVEQIEWARQMRERCGSMNLSSRSWSWRNVDGDDAGDSIEAAE